MSDLQPSTNPPGLTLPASVLTPAAADWRPEDDVNDSLFALAGRIDAGDPDFDAIAGIAATRLLMAGAELDVIASRRQRAMKTRTVVVPTLAGLTARSARRSPRWIGADS